MSSRLLKKSQLPVGRPIFWALLWRMHPDEVNVVHNFRVRRTFSAAC